MHQMTRSWFAACAFIALAMAPAICHGDSSVENASIGGLQRQWLVHLPPGYKAGQAMPLVIVYHGSGGSGARIENGIGLDTVADKLGFITVYPDGIDNVWAGGTADEADAAGVDDVAFTAALLDRLEVEYSVDKQHVVAVGFSNGAHLAHLLGCRLADRFSAIVPIAGTLTTAITCHPTRPVTVVEFHDARDPVNSIQGGRVGINGAGQVWPVTNGIVNWAVLDKCHKPASEARYPATSASPIFFVDDFPNCSGGATVRLYTTNKGTHAWPQEPDANALIGQIATGHL